MVSANPAVRRGRLAYAWIVVVVLFAVAGTFAFTAANTVPDTKAGDGSGTITGYTISAVHYVLNGTNPGNIDEVEFTLDSTPVAGSTIRIQADSVGGVWYACSNVTTSVTCDTTVGTQLTVAATDNLRVIVAD